MWIQSVLGVGSFGGSRCQGSRSGGGNDGTSVTFAGDDKPEKTPPPDEALPFWGLSQLCVAGMPNWCTLADPLVLSCSST